MNYPWKKIEGKEYDEGIRSRAKQKALMYYFVAAYLIYSCYQLLSAKLSGDDTMSLPLTSLFSTVMFAGAVFIVVYATKKMFDQLKASEIKEPSER